jgi:hypothetical protein
MIPATRPLTFPFPSLLARHIHQLNWMPNICRPLLSHTHFRYIPGMCHLCKFVKIVARQSIFSPSSKTSLSQSSQKLRIHQFAGWWCVSGLVFDINYNNVVIFIYSPPSMPLILCNFLDATGRKTKERKNVEGWNCN